MMGMRQLKIILCLAVALSAAMASAQAASATPPSSEHLMETATAKAAKESGIVWMTAKAVKESKSVWVVFDASW